MSEYIEALQKAIKKLHGCDSTHIESVPVVETFRDEIVWQGQVEVFTLINHPKAKKCYAWNHQDGKNLRYVAVLAIPPVDSPLAAVRASIASKLKK